MSVIKLKILWDFFGLFVVKILLYKYKLFICNKYNDIF